MMSKRGRVRVTLNLWRVRVTCQSQCKLRKKMDSSTGKFKNVGKTEGIYIK